MDKSTIMKKFREYREYMEMSGPQLANELNISKQTISAIETDGRGLTTERIDTIFRKHKIDVRYWFTEMSIDEAHITKRGEHPESTTNEVILQEIHDLKKSVKPVEIEDKIAHRVMINRDLKNVVSKIAFLDKHMLDRIDSLIYGYLIGKQEEKEEQLPPVGEKESEYVEERESS